MDPPLPAKDSITDQVDRVIITSLTSWLRYLRKPKRATISVYRVG
jgi:hypothetical protein